MKKFPPFITQLLVVLALGFVGGTGLKAKSADDLVKILNDNLLVMDDKGNQVRSGTATLDKEAGTLVIEFSPNEKMDYKTVSLALKDVDCGNQPGGDPAVGITKSMFYVRIKGNKPLVKIVYAHDVTYSPPGVPTVHIRAGETVMNPGLAFWDNFLNNEDDFLAAFVELAKIYQP